MIAITTKYYSETATRCSRIVATTENGHEVSVSTGRTDITNLDVPDKHRFVAEKLLEEKLGAGRFELVQGGIKGGYVFVIVRKYNPSILEALSLAQATIERLDKKGSAVGTLDVIKALKKELER